jgi:glycosyltransferase involved in cell wall biosynthesis
MAAEGPGDDAAAPPDPPLAVVMKGWPRLSETFIAQELRALEERGLDFVIWSLRRPTDRKVHALHRAVRAPVRYLPEYLHDEPLRVLRALWAAIALPGFRAAFRAWMADFRRDGSINRFRRFGQACVLAAEAGPAVRLVYVHFLHTPGSVTRYAAMMRGWRWGFSAHARDIWTIPEWEKREKLADAAFGVTCTRAGAEHLRALAGAGAQVDLIYHGLDLARFPAPPAVRSSRNGASREEPVQIVSVGRLVEKKGYDDLLFALADLPRALHWRFTHVGGGPLGPRLKEQATRLGIARRIAWRGACDQAEVIETLRAADLFVLAARVAADGDRDGLPNVLMEAASQNLAVIATAVSAIPEFVENGVSGLLVQPRDIPALSSAIFRLSRDPAARAAMGAAARARLVAQFGAAAGADAIAARLRAALAATAAPARAPAPTP